MTRLLRPSESAHDMLGNQVTESAVGNTRVMTNSGCSLSINAELWGEVKWGSPSQRGIIRQHLGIQKIAFSFQIESRKVSSITAKVWRDAYVYKGLQYLVQIYLGVFPLAACGNMSGHSNSHRTHFYSMMKTGWEQSRIGNQRKGNSLLKGWGLFARIEPSRISCEMCNLFFGAFCENLKIKCSVGCPWIQQLAVLWSSSLAMYFWKLQESVRLALII